MHLKIQIQVKVVTRTMAIQVALTIKARHVLQLMINNRNQTINVNVRTIETIEHTHTKHIIAIELFQSMFSFSRCLSCNTKNKNKKKNTQFIRHDKTKPRTKLSFFFLLCNEIYHSDLRFNFNMYINLM